MQDVQNNLYAGSSVLRRTERFRPVHHITVDTSTNTGSTTTTGGATNAGHTTTTGNTTNTGHTTTTGGATNTNSPPVTNDAAKASLSTKIKELRTSIGLDKATSTQTTTAQHSTAQCNQAAKPAAEVAKPVDITKALESAKNIKRQIVSNHLNVSDQQGLTQSLKPIFKFLDTIVKKDITKAKTDVDSLLAQKNRAESKNKPAYNNKIQEAQMKLAKLETQQLIISTELITYETS